MPEEPSTNTSTSRRRFLIGAGAGAVAGTLVAYVSDVANGQISMMADGREVTVALSAPGARSPRRGPRRR